MNCGELNIHVMFKALSILEECEKIQLEDEPKENNMKKYTVYVDEKIESWRKVEVVVEADNAEEAKKAALKEENWKEAYIICDYEDSLDRLDIELCDDCSEPTEVIEDDE